MSNQQRHSSRHRYDRFVEDYKLRRLGDPAVPAAVAPAPRAAAPTREAARRAAPQARSRRTYVRDYVEWLWPYRAAIAALLFCAMVVAAAEMATPLFMRYIVDRILLNTRLDAGARYHALSIAGIVFLGVVVTSGIFSTLKEYRQRLLNSQLTLSLRRSLVDRLLHLPLPELWEMKTGGILSRVAGDVETTATLLQLALVSPAVSLLRLVIAMGVLVSINWHLALTAIALVPGAVLMSFTFSRRIRPIYRSVRRDAEHIDGRLGETFAGIRVVRAFRRETAELLEYMRGRHTVSRKERFAHRRDVVLLTSWGVLMSGVNVVIVWYGGSLNIAGRASIGDIMAFQWYTLLILTPVWAIVSSFSELQRTLAAMERVFDVRARAEDKPDRPDAQDAPRVVNEITFENVEFAYRPGRPVVRDFNLRVAGGSVVALVGRSGAGKTTLTDLVARFHDPTEGRILLNGRDIRSFRLKTYRELLAIVQQDVFLFDGSVRDNIATGRHGASDADVERAARRANAHEFIERLPEGYDTFIGERGVKLSGGQCQRLAIARAIVAAPQILILDEATSNLDTESEQLIQSALASLLAGRTTFVIAHRLSTVRQADLILLLEDGRVVEQGTHDELMRAGGAYSAMVRRQAESNTQEAGAWWH